MLFYMLIFAAIDPLAKNVDINKTPLSDHTKWSLILKCFILWIHVKHIIWNLWTIHTSFKLFICLRIRHLWHWLQLSLYLSFCYHNSKENQIQFSIKKPRPSWIYKYSIIGINLRINMWLYVIMQSCILPI